MTPEYASFEYEVFDENRNRYAVRGIQVGRFAVRATFAADMSPWPFSVDHVPTGASVFRGSFDEVMLVADDLSRFADNDCDETTVAAAIQQMGPTISAWILFLNGRETPAIPLREWRAQQQKQAAA
jgi:hypothetical protein